MVGILKPLRPRQQAALDALKLSLTTGHRRPMLQLPTGAGKTVIGAHITTGALRKGRRVAFAVPMLSLIDQTFERFVENGIDPDDMGVIQGDHEWRRPHAPVQICSVQTLARRGMPQIDVLVVDEAHIRDRRLHTYLTGPESRSVTAVGLSATPWSKGLGLVYDDLISTVTIQDLIDEGHLSPFRVFAPTKPDLDGVKVDPKTGDYQVGGLSALMSDKQIVADVVSTWVERAEGRPTLCFAVDRAHAAVLTEQFNAAGVPAAYVDAFTDREERQAILARLRSGEIKVICNIATMTTGVDEDIRCIVLARPTKSEILFTQIIGRGLRPAPGKDFCLILDHSDTHLRLGMVTDLGRDELDKGKPGAGESKRKDESIPLPRECKACGCLVPTGMYECPACGAVPQRVSKVGVVDGELSELGSDKTPLEKPKSLKDRLAELPRSALWSMIEAHRRDRGKSEGWARHTYKAITGGWPPGNLLFFQCEPSAELNAFIRQRNIAFAKSKGRRFAA